MEAHRAEETLHPYTARLLGLLGTKEPFAVLEETPRRVAELRKRIGRDGLERPWGPGKWSARSVFSHLADAEIGIGFRIRQVLSEEDHRIQAFDQDLWARGYETRDADLAIASQAALRAWNLNLFRSLGPNDLARVAHHPERGDESVDRMIRMLAGHDLNHLGQLEAAASQSG
ncbi:MAG TPA: DinB family protein [Thermoanaerobaculia bacterium]